MPSRQPGHYRSDQQQIILAETQENGDDLSPYSLLANTTYDAGVAVIATNGNCGVPNSFCTVSGPRSVMVPASAKKVIGAGAFDYQTLQTPSYQSLGPTRDNRYKPDVQGPTGTDTASYTNPYGHQPFTGTSGSAPYVAAAAALYAWYMNPDGYLNHYTLSPGQIYAALIDGGDQARFDNTVGSGKLKMPVTGGNQIWGSVTLSYGQYVDIPMTIQNWSGRLSAAIWWPEAATSHNQMWVSIFSPNNVEGGSQDPTSVFQKGIALNRLAYAGETWHIRIGGYPSGSQTVYYAAHVSP